MSKLPKWAKDLTKAEVKHLKEEKIFTKAKATASADFQKSLPHTCKCWICVSIGNKLNKQEAL